MQHRVAQADLVFATMRTPSALRWLPLVAAVWCGLPAAQAQTPADPYNYSRTSSFTYQANGLLQSETIEPDQPQLCVTTSYTYGDAYGNKTAASTASCTGAAGLTLFDGRTSNTTFAAQTGRIGSSTGATVPVPAGAFATSAANAVAHSESRVYDPRFGAVVTLTGPNGLATHWTLDNFGRKTRETRADGTRTEAYFCWLRIYNPGTGAMDAATAVNAPSNSPGCHNGSAPSAQVPAPAANEAPADAVRYEHSVPQSSAGAQIGPFARVYFDRAGRKIRSVTQAFDGTGQPAGPGQLIVQDTDYNAFGAAYLTTQPYFLVTGSSTTAGAADVGMTLTVYDALGRPTASYTTDPVVTGVKSGGGVANMAFGSRGTRRAAVTTVLYTGLTTLSTDDKGRTRKEEKNPDGLVVRVTDATGTTADNGAQLVHQHDAFGNLVRTKDALQNIVAIAYDIRGRKVSLNDPDAGVTAYCYDALGQLKAQQSSNQRGSHGASSCPSNSGLGTTAPAVAGWTTLAYDRLGRMTSRAAPEYTSTWRYDRNADASFCMQGAAPNRGAGKLCQTSTSHGVNKKWLYDNLGRPLNSRTDVTSGPSLATAVSYDSNGRVATQTYPTGVRLNYVYTTRGFMQSARLDTAVTVAPLAGSTCTPTASCTLAANTVLWQATAINAWGRAEQHSYANGVNNRAVFEAQSGRLTHLTAGPTTTNSVVDQRYSWDSVNLLTQRIDAIGDATGVQVLDTFQYDRLGRLTDYAVSGGSGATPASRNVTLQYNALGLLLSKSDVGNYSYPTQGVANGRPHAVQSVAGAHSASYTYDLNGNAITASGGKWRSMAYTSFNLPDGTAGTGGIAGASGTPRSTWQYDENQQRIRETRVNASGTRTTWSLHPDNQGGLAFEREVPPSGAAHNRHYVSAGGGAFAVIITTGNLPTLTTNQTAPTLLSSVTAVKVEYWHKDQLGSLIATTDHRGVVTARYAYDPFGKRRYTNSSYDAFGSLVIDWSNTSNNGTDRGFTGHEHLDDLGLIHMNGRIFDPLLGRFMQADPFIQDPGNLQSFDRYAYCFNSPLICTDPSGYFSLKKLVRVIVAIVVTYVTYGAAAEFLAFTVQAGASGTAIGAGAISGFAGGAVATGTIKGAIQGAFSGALFGAVGNAVGTAGLEGGNIVNAGKFAEAVALHGVAGCVSSVAGGGKCGPGALSAAFSKAALPMTAGYKGGIERAFVHATIGGTGSVLGGGKFANGAVTGAFSYLLNACANGQCGSSPEENGVPTGETLGDRNATLTAQGGLQVSGHALIAGFSYSETASVDTNYQLCAAQTACMRLGPGVFLGGGSQYAFNYRPDFNLQSSGDFSLSIGLGADIGTGSWSAGAQGMYGMTDRSFTGAKGWLGYGAGASAGVDICVQRIRTCVRSPQ